MQQLPKITKQERAYVCSKDYSLFFSYYFIDYIKYPFADFHLEMFQDVADLMDDKYREIVWLMFRESAKTSIAKGFIAWLLCYGKRRYLNVDSFDKENAERILFDVVLELQTNERIKADFGELDIITCVQNFYLLAEELSRTLGRNPDTPKNLTKTTKTN